jgi:hypothetical protein
MTTATGTTATSAAADVASAIAGAASSAAAAVGLTRPARGSNATGGQPSPNSTLYIGNIFFEVNEQSLEDHFARYGKIKKTRIVYDARGLSKG